MKKTLLLAIILCAILPLAIAQISPQVEHVIVIGLDAASPRGIQKARTPNINKLIKGGTSSFNGRCILAPSSSQNWVTMLTGAIPVQHGVTSNNWKRNYRVIQPIIDGTEDVFPSIFSWVHQQRPEAKIYFFQEWANLSRMFEKSQMDIAYTGKPGEKVFNECMDNFFKDRPEFSFIHILEIDKVGHTNGHDTEEYYRAIEKYDALIGQFVDRLTAENLWDKTVILIVADHGGLVRSHSGETNEAINIPIILYGKGVAQGKTLNTPYFIFDVAPTVAWLLGVTPPDVCVGKPLKDAFSEENKELRYVPMPRLSHNGGLIKESCVVVDIKADWDNCVIHYELDGSVPDKNSPVYTSPLKLTKNTILKAVAVRDGLMSLPVESQFRFVTSADNPKVQYAYYEGEFEFMPDFSLLEPLSQGTTYEFSLNGIETRAEHYAILFKSKIQIKKSGMYRFHPRSDDGCMLRVDGKVLTKSADQHFSERFADVELTAGVHDIELSYLQDMKRAYLDLYIEGPGLVNQIVSPNMLLK